MQIYIEWFKNKIKCNNKFNFNQYNRIMVEIFLN